MNKANMDIRLGVEDYQFSLIKPCRSYNQLPSKIRLSFQLKGDFLPAAVSDNLADTVDYEALCNYIRYALTSFNCADVAEISETIKKSILAFSPLISGGYVSICLSCHDTFINEQALL